MEKIARLGESGGGGDGYGKGREKEYPVGGRSQGKITGVGVVSKDEAGGVEEVPPLISNGDIPSLKEEPSVVVRHKSWDRTEGKEVRNGNIIVPGGGGGFYEKENGSP